MPEESATPDLVELAQQVIKAAVRRDFDAVMGSWDLDARLDHRALGIAARGHAAIRRLYKDVRGGRDSGEGETGLRVGLDWRGRGTAPSLLRVGTEDGRLGRDLISSHRLDCGSDPERLQAFRESIGHITADD